MRDLYFSPNQDYTYEGPIEVSPETISKLLDTNNDNSGYFPKGLFYCVEKTIDGPIYVAVDNSAGDAFTEDFYDLEDAKNWLLAEEDDDPYFDANEIRADKGVDLLGTIAIGERLNLFTEANDLVKHNDSQLAYDDEETQLNKQIFSKLASISMALAKELDCDPRFIMNDMINDLKLINGEQLTTIINQNSTWSEMTNQLATAAKDIGVDSNIALNALLKMDERECVELMKDIIGKNRLNMKQQNNKINTFSGNMLEGLERTLNEDKATQDAFILKFGEQAFDDFKRLKQRLKNKGISVDLSYHIAHTDPEQMEQILYNAEHRIESSSEEEQRVKVAENENYEIWHIKNYKTAMKYGVDTCWCITGRYPNNGFTQEQLNHDPKESQASSYFPSYLNSDYTMYLFAFPKKDSLKKYCICPNKDSEGAVVWTPDDHRFSISPELGSNSADSEEGRTLLRNLPEFTYNDFSTTVQEWAVRNGQLISYNGKDISLVIPNTVVSISGSAFRNNTTIKSVVIPDSVENIAPCGFENCTSLTSITISGSVSIIPAHCFEGCTGLTKVVLKDGVKQVGPGSFADCANLQHVYIPATVVGSGDIQGLGIEAFRGCPDSIKLITPKHVVYLPQSSDAIQYYIKHLYFVVNDLSEYRRATEGLNVVCNGILYRGNNSGGFDEVGPFNDNVLPESLHESLNEDGEKVPINFSSAELNDPSALKSFSNKAKDSINRLENEKAIKAAKAYVNKYINRSGMSDMDILNSIKNTIDINSMQPTKLLELVRAFTVVSNNSNDHRYWYNDNDTKHYLSYITRLVPEALELVSVARSDIENEPEYESSVQEGLIDDMASVIVAWVKENPEEAGSQNNVDSSKVSNSLSRFTPSLSYRVSLPYKLSDLIDREWIDMSDVISEVDYEVNGIVDDYVTVSDNGWGEIIIEDIPFDAYDDIASFDYDDVFDNIINNALAHRSSNSNVYDTYAKIKETLNHYVFDVMGLHTDDLYEGGKIYYQNGNDGTDFDWEANDKTCEFEIFYNNERGACKVYATKDDTLEGYYWADKGAGDGTAIEPVELNEGDAAALMMFLQKNADDKGLYNAEADLIFNNVSESLTEKVSVVKKDAKFAVLNNNKEVKVFNTEKAAKNFATKLAKESNKNTAKVLFDNDKLITDESLNESKKDTYIIKYWEDKYSRDQGLSDVYIEEFDDLNKAIDAADILFDNVESVEVIKNEGTNHEEVVYGRYPEDESLTESYPTDTPVEKIEQDYEKEYGKPLDWKTVPYVKCRDKFLSGWGAAEGRNHYQVVLCGNSVEAANIEYTMKNVAKEEQLANIGRGFGIKFNPSINSYILGVQAKVWGGGKKYENLEVEKNKSLKEGKYNNSYDYAPDDHVEYIFPEFTDADKSVAKVYNLNFERNVGDGYLWSGRWEDINSFCNDYLGYELHPDYLFDYGECPPEETVALGEATVKDGDFYINVEDKKEEQLKEDAQDIVTIHVYGKTKQMPRSAAIKEFTKAYYSSEGSERERYSNILMDLRAGESECFDEDRDYDIKHNNKQRARFTPELVEFINDKIGKANYNDSFTEVKDGFMISVTPIVIVGETEISPRRRIRVTNNADINISEVCQNEQDFEEAKQGVLDLFKVYAENSNLHEDVNTIDYLFGENTYPYSYTDDDAYNAIMAGLDQNVIKDKLNASEITFDENNLDDTVKTNIIVFGDDLYDLFFNEALSEYKSKGGILTEDFTDLPADIQDKLNQLADLVSPRLGLGRDFVINDFVTDLSNAPADQREGLYNQIRELNIEEYANQLANQILGDENTYQQVVSELGGTYALGESAETNDLPLIDDIVSKLNNGIALHADELGYEDGEAAVWSIGFGYNSDDPNTIYVLTGEDLEPVPFKLDELAAMLDADGATIEDGCSLELINNIWDALDGVERIDDDGIIMEDLVSIDSFGSKFKK